MITSWWWLSPKKNKTRTSYKTKPNLYQQTVNKQINTQTESYHPWTPIISGSLTFPNVFSKKNKKNTFQTFSGCRNQQKEKADGQPLPLPYLKRMVKRRLYLSHPSQNVNPFIGMLGKFLIELTILYFKSSWIGTKKLTHLLRVSASVTSYLEQPSTETKQKQQAAKSNMSPKKQQTGILLLWNGYLRKDNPRITTHLKTKHVSWNLCWLQDALSCWFFFLNLFWGDLIGFSIFFRGKPPTQHSRWRGACVSAAHKRLANALPGLRSVGSWRRNDDNDGTTAPQRERGSFPSSKTTQVIHKMMYNLWVWKNHKKGVGVYD